MKDKYNKISKEKLEEYLKDIMTDVVSNNEKSFNIYTSGYIDDNGELRCGFLEEFDKAMKEELKKLNK